MYNKIFIKTIMVDIQPDEKYLYLGQVSLSKAAALFLCLKTMCDCREPLRLAR